MEKIKLIEKPDGNIYYATDHPSPRIGVFCMITSPEMDENDTHLQYLFCEDEVIVKQLDYDEGEYEEIRRIDGEEFASLAKKYFQPISVWEAKVKAISIDGYEYDFARKMYYIRLDNDSPETIEEQTKLLKERFGSVDITYDKATNLRLYFTLDNKGN